MYVAISYSIKQLKLNATSYVVVCLISAFKEKQPTMQNTMKGPIPPAYTYVATSDSWRNRSY